MSPLCGVFIRSLKSEEKQCFLHKNCIVLLRLYISCVNYWYGKNSNWATNQVKKGRFTKKDNKLNTK